VKPIVSLQGEVRLPEGDIIITSGPLVGLGDVAVYSTLAKRFHELGYKVYVDKDNAARNDEIMDLFWWRNPFIAGQTDRKPNAGYIRQGLFYELANRYPCGSIEAMERAHGLPPPYSIAPWANYEPKGYHVDLSGHVLMDFSAVSSNIADQGVAEFLRAMKGKYRNAPFVQLLMPKWASLHPPKVQMESIQVESIYQYLDMLHGARGWIGSEAGGQSLAALARGEHRVSEYGVRPECSVLITVPTWNERGYVYAGLDYRATQFAQGETSDWHMPHEMVQHVYELRCALSQEQMRARA